MKSKYYIKNIISNINIIENLTDELFCDSMPKINDEFYQAKASHNESDLARINDNLNAIVLDLTDKGVY